LVLTLDRSLEDTLPYLFSLLGIVEGDDPLAQMDGQLKKRRTLEAIKRILLRESLNQPLMAIFEDLHWIDEATQEFLNLLADSLGTAKILLLVNSGSPMPLVRTSNLRHHLVGAVATNEPVRPDSPKLIKRCTPLLLQFRGSFDLRFRVQEFDRRSKQLQSISLGYAREQLFDRRAVTANTVEQRLQLRRVALGHAGQGIQGQQNLVGFLFRDIHYQDRNHRRWCGLGPQVSIDQDQPAVGQFPREQRIRVANFRQKSAQRSTLRLRMNPPILWIC
jgi:hypothetical protein